MKSTKKVNKKATKKATQKIALTDNQKSLINYLKNNGIFEQFKQNCEDYREGGKSSYEGFIGGGGWKISAAFIWSGTPECNKNSSFWSFHSNKFMEENEGSGVLLNEEVMYKGLSPQGKLVLRFLHAGEVVTRRTMFVHGIMSLSGVVNQLNKHYDVTGYWSTDCTGRREKVYQCKM